MSDLTPLERYALAFDARDDAGLNKVLQEAEKDPGLEQAIVDLHRNFDGERTMTEHLQATEERASQVQG